MTDNELQIKRDVGMTIYDLDKQATPMPWTVNESDPSWPMHSYELDGQFFTVVERANAKLSAHCRNHFMEALHGMAHVRNELLATRGDETAEQLTAFINDAKEELATLIAKLEKVK